jgi:hypothetical protein
MHSSIAHLIFGILSAAFLTGSIIVVRNTITINQLNNSFRKKTCGNTRPVIFPKPGSKNELIVLNKKPIYHLPESQHKMKLLN